MLFVDVTTITSVSLYSNWDSDAEMQKLWMKIFKFGIYCFLWNTSYYYNISFKIFELCTLLLPEVSLKSWQLSIDMVESSLAWPTFYLPIIYGRGWKEKVW